MTTAFRAGAGEAGMRLDAALAARGAAASRAEGQRLVDGGQVTVDGMRRLKSYRLEEGQEVRLAPAPEPVAVQPAEFSVVWEDEHVLVIDKPAGVVVHPGAGNPRGTLVQALAGRARGGPDPERPGIVHRLDRDTSGLLIVAASEPAHAELTRMLRAREVVREYLALVAGRPAASGTIDAPLGRDRANPTLVSTRSARPRRALTHFTVEEALARTALLRVRLETGRTHQIRAHLAAIGHPVCGDRRYGGHQSGLPLGLSRQFLHSARLVFSHPVTREEIDCESKPPADLRGALDVARRDPASGGPDRG